MTKAEAIAMLKRIQEPEAWEPQITQAAFEALDMSIKALEQEPCEDTISRQAAIDALKNERSDWNCDYNVPVDHCIDAIYSVPSVQPERKTEDFEKGLHDMFDHIWNCEIEHPIFQDTVGELMQAVIQLYRRVVQPCEEGEQDGNQEEGS